MALPTGITDERSPSRAPATYGSPLIIGPASPEFLVELWRAPDTANAEPGTFVLLKTLRIPDPQGALYIDPLPNTPTFYHYQIRHVRAGFSTGDFLPRRIRRRAERILADTLAGRPMAVPVVSYTGEIAGAPALPIARGGHGVFLETFETPISNWVAVIAAAGTAETYPLEGRAGGRVYQTNGYRWRRFPGKIAYDPTKLYRMRVTVRRRSDAGAGTKLFFCGVAGIAADGVTLVNIVGGNSDGSQHYFCASGANQDLWTVDAWQDFTGWLRGYGTPSGGASPDPRNPGVMHADVRYIAPLIIANYDGTASPDLVQVDEISLEVTDEDAQGRTYESIDSPGTLAPTTTSDDGLAGKPIMRGYQVHLAQDGDTIVWNPPFNTPPKTKVSGGKSFDNTGGNWTPAYNTTGPQFEDKKIVSGTALQGTVFAKLRQPGAATPRAHDFAGNLLDAIDEFEGLVLSFAPAANNTYTVRVHANITGDSKLGGLVQFTLVVAIDTRPTGGAWTERTTTTFEASTTDLTPESFDFERNVPVAVAGLISTSEIAVRVKSFTINGLSQTSSFWARGANNGVYNGRGVLYSTSTDNLTPATDAANPATVEAWT